MQVPHWSASRFALWDQCPSLFKSRYVDGAVLEPTEALCFGSAVHRGLEAHFNGEDGERAFRAMWKQLAHEELGGQVDPKLTGMGLRLLDQVFDLGLEGTPERAFSLDTEQDLGAPVVGAIDLWGDPQDRPVVYDFKTTVGAWSQERAQKEVWQPCLYAWAYWDATDVWPDFEYIVLNRATGALSRFRRVWTPEEYLAQMSEAWARMTAIALCVQADVYVCHGRHGSCPECGDRWSHEHVCYPAPLRIRV